MASGKKVAIQDDDTAQIIAEANEFMARMRNISPVKTKEFRSVGTSITPTKSKTFKSVASSPIKWPDSSPSHSPDIQCVAVSPEKVTVISSDDNSEEVRKQLYGSSSSSSE